MTKRHRVTASEARAAVDYIRSMTHDPEVAHGEEDRMRYQVLEAIAGGADNPVELAEIALSTEELTFPRWCA